MIDSSKIYLKHLFFILLLPFLVLFLLKLFGFDGLYGQDSYEYLRYTKAIQEYTIAGKHPNSFFWPVLYPTIGSFLGFIFSDILALQLLSCLSFSLACVYILKTIKLIYPKDSFQFIYVLVFIVFAPFLLKMGLLIMSDSLALFFVVLSFYFFFKSYYKNGSLTPVLVFSTCAFMTRYPSIIITLPIVVYTLFLILKRSRFKDFAIAVILSFIVCIPFIILQWENLFKASSNYFLQLWSVANFFQSSFITNDGTVSYKFINLVYVSYLFLHPGFIFIGGVLTFVLLKNYKLLISFHQKMLFFSILLYGLFLAGIPFQNPRILGLVFPLVLLLMFPAFTKLMKVKLISNKVFIIAILCIALQVSFFTITFKPIFHRSIIEKELTMMLDSYQGNTLYSFDVDLALQGRNLSFDYKNLYLKRYKNYQKNDLILFDPERYKVQWKDKNPMLNWEYIIENYSLQLLETHPKGWKLYRIE